MDVNFDLCKIQLDAKAAQERMMVVIVFVDERLESAKLDVLWSTIDPILGLLSVHIPFELVVVNFALM